MKRISAVAVPLAVVLLAVPWTLYLRERQRVSPGAPPAAAGAKRVPPAEPPAPAEPPPAPGPAADVRRLSQDRLAEDPLDLVGLALQLAAQEQERIRGYEDRLAQMADRLALAESYRTACRWTELADLAETAIR